MKLTALTIAPINSWSPVSEKNPLRAVVKLQGEHSTIECVLSESSMRRMLEVCADEIAAQSKQRVAEFCEAVTQLDGGKATQMIEGQ